MGVTLRPTVGESSASINYSGFHRIRNILIELTIEHLCDPDRHTNVRTALKSWAPKHTTIDYDVMATASNETLDQLKAMHLYGLFLFVFHSDCDGKWSGADLVEVWKWLNLVVPFVQRNLVQPRVEDDDLYFIGEMMSVFDEAVHNVQDVELS